MLELQASQSVIEKLAKRTDGEAPVSMFVENWTAKKVERQIAYHSTFGCFRERCNQDHEAIRWFFR
jgi:hypothetical protein